MTAFNGAVARAKGRDVGRRAQILVSTSCKAEDFRVRTGCNDDIAFGDDADWTALAVPFDNNDITYVCAASSGRLPGLWLRQLQPRPRGCKHRYWHLRSPRENSLHA